MVELWRDRPFVVRKLEQFAKVVRESNAEPMQGEARTLELVGAGEVGITFIGHSSFHLQMGGKNVLVDPVFATRLVVLRRQRRPGLVLRDLPAISSSPAARIPSGWRLSPSFSMCRSRRSLRRGLRGPRRACPNGG